MTRHKPGAPNGNRNRALSSQPKRGKTAIMSMSYETWEAFKAACDLHEGHCLDNDAAYIEQWRALNRAGIWKYIEQYQGIIDPDVLIM